MGNFNLAGIALTIGIFFALFAIILSFINVSNPYSGFESSVTELIFDMLVEVIF